MAKSTIWLSFDLGIGGDYNGLFTWLDAQDAKECGNSLAVFKYEPHGKRPIKDQIQNEIKKRVEVDKRTRIYIIYRDNETNKNKGAFLFGRRKAPSWTGFALSSDDLVDVED